MQTIKRRIGIFMHQFDGGGAERMTVILANALYEAGHEVTFIVRSGKGESRYLLRTFPYPGKLLQCPVHLFLF